MIITAGRQGEQLCWSELWTRFSARTGADGESASSRARQLALHRQASSIRLTCSVRSSLAITQQATPSTWTARKIRPGERGKPQADHQGRRRDPGRDLAGPPERRHHRAHPGTMPRCGKTWPRTPSIPRRRAQLPHNTQKATTTAALAGRVIHSETLIPVSTGEPIAGPDGISQVKL